MLFESQQLVNPNADEDFKWVLTRFILFELENSLNSLPHEELYKVDALIKYHEKLDNFEICRKLLNYKNICLNSNTKSN